MVKVVVGTGDAIHDLVAAFIQANTSGWLGPLYIAACLDSFFLGILFSQVRFYYLKFPKDTIWIKRLVGLIFVLSVGKTTVSFTTVWNTNVVAFGNWRFAGTTPWSKWIVPVCQVLVSTVAQSFFVWRAFTLMRRNWYLLFVLITLMLSVLAFAIGYTVMLSVDPYHIPNSLNFGVPMLVIGLVVDVIITAVVSYKLIKSRGGLMRRTDKALSQMLSITWESAAPPAVSQMIHVILTFVTLTSSTWGSVFNTLTPRLYAFSLLHTLNARVAVRSILAQETSAWQEEGQQGPTNHRTQKKTNTGGPLVPPAVSKKDQMALISPAQVQTGINFQSPPDALGCGSGEAGLALGRGLHSRDMKSISALEAKKGNTERTAPTY